jgi:Domain of unknown function (DU1801)
MSNAHLVLNDHPKPMKDALLSLRKLVLKTAQETEGVGPIEEALKWGQLSFLTRESGSGSTIRIDALRDDPTKYAMYFHCQSGLVGDFRNLYSTQLKFIGERSIEFSLGETLPIAELKHCIALALTHHLRKRFSKKK